MTVIQRQKCHEASTRVDFLTLPVRLGRREKESVEEEEVFLGFVVKVIRRVY